MIEQFYYHLNCIYLYLYCRSKPNIYQCKRKDIQDLNLFVEFFLLLNELYDKTTINSYEIHVNLSLEYDLTNSRVSAIW